MTTSSNSALQYAHEQRDHFLSSLKEFLQIPSISTDPAHKADMDQAARWLADALNELKFQDVNIFPTRGNPMVFGQLMQAGENAPTILIYGHYDVQPPDPEELWQSGPFDPEIRGENLFARGSSDMKGQILAAISAVEAVIQTGDIPVNIKFLFEGEEEIGSPNMA